MLKKTFKIFVLVLFFMFIFSGIGFCDSEDDYLLMEIRSSYEPIHIYDSQSGVYLGCLNCSEYDFNSIFNKFGEYGSRYSERSIWNEYGTYGSRYSFKSPWNSYSFEPPKLVGSSGKFYGYLSVNPFLGYPTLNPKKLKKKGVEDPFVFDFVFDEDKDKEENDLFNDDPFDDEWK